MRSFFLRTAATLFILFPAPSNAADRPAARPTNADLTALFDADQADRAGPAIDWQTVAPRDKHRRAQTQALLDAGTLASGDDFYHAAFIFQHGEGADDFLKAHVLATIAVARGQAEATWIAAATLDRFLLDSGRSQVLGTQFKRGLDGRVTQEPYARALLPDSVRAAMGVPPLADQRKRVADYEAEAAGGGGHVAQQVDLPTNACSFPGVAEMIDAHHPHFLIIGEQHGTVETPAAFADIVCLVSLRAPVTVAIEESEGSQTAIDAFVGSDGGSDARAALLGDPIWHFPMKDGRSSEAMLTLIERLRTLHATGRVARVIAFQPTTPTHGNDDYNRAMAAVLMRQVPPQGLTLILTGSLHAMRKRVDFLGPSFMPMAGYLPDDATITLDARPQGGKQWACAPHCGPMTMNPESEPHQRGLVMEPAADGPYSGVLYLGTDATASTPAGVTSSAPPAPPPAGRSAPDRGSR